MRIETRWRATTLSHLVVAGLVVAGCDPVHAQEVDALGGETPGVHKGPLHRPGQPCTLCHDGAIGDPPGFSVAGTVFLRPSTLEGVNGATVSMTDVTGSSYSSTTNAAGNFYITPSQWTPAYPITSVVVQSGSLAATMYSEIGWAGSCATCHFDPVGPNSDGHISLELNNGGTPL